MVLAVTVFEELSRDMFRGGAGGGYDARDDRKGEFLGDLLPAKTGLGAPFVSLGTLEPFGDALRPPDGIKGVP